MPVVRFALEEFSASDVVSDLDTDEVEALFSALDTDGSGSVSEEEISSFLEENKPDAASMGAVVPRPPPPPESGSEGTESAAAGAGGAGGGSASSETYYPLDTNEDGIVSLEERLAGSATSSDSSDANTVALDVLSAALSAYSAKQSSTSGDTWSSIFGTLDAAA